MKECFGKVLRPSQLSQVKGDLRPKTHPSFYGIILMILWKKGLVQSFVVI